MSSDSWGGFELINDVDRLTKSALAFRIVKIAANYQIGIKLGWNVSKDFRKEFENDSNVIPFELLDNPTMSEADVLFMGNRVGFSTDHTRVDTGESLDDRMHRVQEFLEDVLKIDSIIGIIIHVNSGFGEESATEIKASEFKATIIPMYYEGELKNFTPTVKFIIRK